MPKTLVVHLETCTILSQLLERANPTRNFFHQILRQIERGKVSTGVRLRWLFSSRLTVIPGPPLFSLTVQLLDPFPCRVEFIKDIQ